MGLTFLKKGAEARAAERKADAIREQREKQRSARRFWLKEGDEPARITFVDGVLTEDGVLDYPATYNQHAVKRNGHWRNYYPCTSDEEPCPLCEQDNYATFVALFTVIDHRRWKSRDGKVYKNERKLFVAKSDTLKLLQKRALKYGGLKGWTVSVERFGKKSPEVGTSFDFEEKVSLKQLAADLKLDKETITPFNYDEVIPQFSAKQLREQGFGRHQRDDDEDDERELKKQAKSRRTEEVDDDDAFEERRKKRARDEDDDDEPKAARRPAHRDADDDDDEDDAKPRHRRAVADDEDEDGGRPARRRARGSEDDDDEAPAKRRAHAAADADDEDEDDAPRRRRPSRADEDDDGDDKPVRKRRAAEDDDDGVEEVRVVGIKKGKVTSVQTLRPDDDDDDDVPFDPDEDDGEADGPEEHPEPVKPKAAVKKKAAAKKATKKAKDFDPDEEM